MGTSPRGNLVLILIYGAGISQPEREQLCLGPLAKAGTSCHRSMVQESQLAPFSS